MKPIHYVVLLLVVLLLFGARRLPDLAKSVGQSLKIFKGEIKDLTDDKPADAPPASAAPQQVPSAPPVTPSAAVPGMIYQAPVEVPRPVVSPESASAPPTSAPPAETKPDVSPTASGADGHTQS